MIVSGRRRSSGYCQCRKTKKEITAKNIQFMHRMTARTTMTTATMMTTMTAMKDLRRRALTTPDPRPKKPISRHQFDCELIYQSRTVDRCPLRFTPLRGMSSTTSFLGLLTKIISRLFSADRQDHLKISILRILLKGKRMETSNLNGP